MEMHPQEEYGKYYPERASSSESQQSHLDPISGDNDGTQEAKPPSHKSTQSHFQDELSSRRKFLKTLLDEKYKNDLQNIKYWEIFTRCVSGVGIGIIFLGAIAAIVISFFAGPLAGSVVGGLSILSGLITNMYLHLVADPTGKANEQLENTCNMIKEEIERTEDIELLMKLKANDQEEYIKYKLYKHTDVLTSSTDTEASRKRQKPPKRPKTDK